MEGCPARAHPLVRIWESFMYVLTLEGSSGDTEGGVIPLEMVPKLWHANASNEDDPSPMDRQV